MLTQDIVGLKSDIVDLEFVIAELKSDIERLKSELEEAARIRAALEAKLAETLSELGKMRNVLEEKDDEGRTLLERLEAMEERQVTIEGETRALPVPFFVIATQNPARQVGTFPLPESQLDRFLMRIQLGYPDAHSERALLLGRERRDVLRDLHAVVTPETLIAAQAQVPDVHVADALVDYLQDLLAYTRDPQHFAMGLSPRGGIALLRAAQSWAFLAGRPHVIPEDIQAVFAPVVGHRLVPRTPAESAGPQELAEHLLRQVPIP